MLKYHRKTTLLKKCGLQNWFCLFMLRCIRWDCELVWQQSIRSIVLVVEVTHPTAMPKVTGLVSSSDKEFFVLLLRVYFWCIHHYLLGNIAIPLAMLFLFISTLYIVQSLWLNIRIWRYRQSIIVIWFSTEAYKLH